jgi:hypothetical protein
MMAFSQIGAGAWIIYGNSHMKTKEKTPVQRPVSSRSGDNYQRSYTGALIAITPGSLGWGGYVFLVLLTLLMTYGMFYMGVPVFLVIVIALILVIIFLNMTMGKKLFFDRHLEIRPLVYGRKQIFPYETMDVEVTRDMYPAYRHFRIILIKNEGQSFSEKTLATISGLFMAEEEFALVEYFLRARAQKFRMINNTEETIYPPDYDRGLYPFHITLSFKNKESWRFIFNIGLFMAILITVAVLQGLGLIGQ